MSKRNIEAVYPLSPMQQGMLFHSLYAPESGAYLEQLTCVLQGNLNILAFKRAWQEVINRNPVLRTSFVWKKLDQMLQVVHEQVELPLEELDWRTHSKDEQQNLLENYLKDVRCRGFDLSKAPLIRLTLIRMDENAYQFVWSHHHALLDGWSMPLLLKELFTFYEAYNLGKEIYLEPNRPYRDYIAWLQKQDVKKAETFWKNRLSGFRQPTPFGIDHPRESIAIEAEKYIELEIHLSNAITAVLQSLIRQLHLTWSTIIQAAWGLLLSRYSGEEDVVFGATVSGRPAELSGVEKMIGNFINTLPVRISLPHNMIVADWLVSLQAQFAEMRQFEYSPLVKIQEWSELPRGLPLFESILVFENYPVDTSLKEQKGSLQIDSVRSIEQTNYLITLVSGPGETLPLKISYDSWRFTSTQIQRLLGHLKTLLEGIAANPNCSLGSLSILPEAELTQIYLDWNATNGSFPNQFCIHELFELQVQKTPDSIAVNFYGQILTYQELNKRANQLANYLRTIGVRPEVMVGISIERTPEMIVGILGVLKAGGAYVPFDPANPKDRIKYMLEDTQVPILLTQMPIAQEHSELVNEPGCQVVYLDRDWEKITNFSHENPLSGAKPSNLAYVIYTSGSTGKPKGTLLQHQGVCNMARALEELYPVDSQSRVLQFAPFSFDGAVAEIFSALLVGATLVMTRRETLLSTEDLLELLREQRITTATMPPSMLAVLPAEKLPELRTVVSVGEACRSDIVARWSSGRRFFNGYGPTESTVATTLCLMENRDRFDLSIPIGRPISNIKVFIFDQNMQPVPIGVPGELHIAGVGLARGYLNRPDMTAEKFIPNPLLKLLPKVVENHQPIPDVPAVPSDAIRRIYKTGDLARYNEDGTIEFLGRTDNQVKVRGYRVELDEIERVLLTHPALLQAAVRMYPEYTQAPSAIDRQDAGKEQRLVAYVVPALKEGGDVNSAPKVVLSVEDLRQHLRQFLPEYMVPMIFIEMDTLPLTTSGKVDKKALPAPDGKRIGSESTYFPPRDPIEGVLCELWGRVLAVERVGVRDNFFDLGGHSLLATQLISRIREAFKVEVPLRDLFESPTVAELAERVKRAIQETSGLDAPPILPRPASDVGSTLPQLLSFSQQRLWFLDQLDPGNLFYNIPMAVRLNGHLDESLIERCLNEVIKRHAVLRTTFRSEGGKPVQVIASDLMLHIPIEDLSGLPTEQREKETLSWVQKETLQPFELSQGLLLRGRLLRLSDDDHIILLTMHHIVSDGWSMNILISELASLYMAYLLGLPSPFPPLPIQYADFAYWQREWLQGEVLERQLKYWKEKLANHPMILELPTDRPRPAVQSSRGSTEAFELPMDLLKKLRALGREEGATLFITLLAAWKTFLFRYSGQEDISIGTAIANRNREEIEGLIGFFVNTLVMRTDLSGEPSFKDMLKRVREVALGAYAHQDLPFETLVEALQPERNLSHTPLFQVAFALQNIPAQRFEFPGLTIKPFLIESGTAKYDLTLMMGENPNGLAGALEYNTDLFDRVTIQRMIENFKTLLESIIKAPDQSISTISILTNEERHRVLVEWNNSAVSTPIDRCVHELFEAQVLERPEALAAIFAASAEAKTAPDYQVLTYAELNQRANQLSRYLSKLGVGPEKLVGISTERSLDMIVGILGILKAGGAYLPLDPTYPQDRLAFMLEDSQIQVLLTQSHLMEQLDPLLQGSHAPRVVRLDEDWPLISRESPENPANRVKPENLAYIIYTSGSTGKPKGTLLRHAGLSNLSAVQKEAFGINEGSRVLQFSPFSFDASVWETFMALANGVALCLTRQEVLANGSELVRLLRVLKVTNVTLPPSVLRTLPVEDLPDLLTVIAAGEACTPELVARWAPGRDFFNAYGPTETTVCASMYRCAEKDQAAPPIGRPIGNTRLYILDKNLEPVPIGVPGELHVSGVSLAREYLRRPEMTAAKFVTNPFEENFKISISEASISRPISRLYKTGDLVRYRGDGNIEFLGRIDNQVKVRGFRIELGEIENALSSHPGLREVAVIVREDIPSDKRLVAYLVPAQQEDILNVGELRLFLRRTIPEYMVPSVFVFLKALPLSPSGKVDRRALPVPEASRPELEREYIAPRNDVEKRLAEISASLLGIEQVGVFDNFFELGGHSLLATQFLSRIREAFDIELPLRILFEFPTVAALAEKVGNTQKTDQMDRSRLLQMLKRIDELTEEEVKMLLEKKRSSDVRQKVLIQTSSVKSGGLGNE